MDDDEIGIITKDSVTFFDLDNNQISKKVDYLPWEPMALSKKGLQISRS